MKYGKQKCSCGHPVCGDWWLIGIGKFVQGSGFTEQEADLILSALEGSASSEEGPEAVAPRYVQWTEAGGVRVDLDLFLKSDAGKAALARFERHEQRSCEGSERRQSAIEDAFYEAQGDIFTTETRWGEVSAWIAARAEEQRTSERRPIADEESALPRGLPSGSDVVRTNAAKYLRAFLTYLDPEDNESSYNSIEDTAHALERATAEQPSCGQDARDAPKHGDDAGDGLRYIMCKVGFGEHYGRWLLIPHADGQYVTAAKLEPFSMSILEHQLIAAQQRQGGGA